MSGADRRGFDWKEIAGALHISGISSRMTFGREVERLNAKNIDGEPRTILPKEESDSAQVKPGKAPEKRSKKPLSTNLPKAAATARQAKRETVKR